MPNKKSFWVVEVDDNDELEAELNKARPGWELHSWSSCYAPNAIYYTIVFKTIGG